MTQTLEEKSQNAFNKGMQDAIAGKLNVEQFEQNLLQKYFSGFATGQAKKRSISVKDEKIYILQFARGMSDANAGHRPAVFGGAYLEGYKLFVQTPNRNSDSELDYINEIRWEYDLPPISREDLRD